jgi:hypothetical protein
MLLPPVEKTSLPRSRAALDLPTARAPPKVLCIGCGKLTKAQGRIVFVKYNETGSPPQRIAGGSACAAANKFAAMGERVP